MTSDLIIKYLVFMECRLRHIARYPFLLGKDENVVGLTYTCLVDSDTADKLKIESHGFRFIRNNFNQELMLLVVRDDEI